MSQAPTRFSELGGICDQLRRQPHHEHSRPMNARDLPKQQVQRVEMGGVHYEPPGSQLVVWGIHGGSDFVIALRIGDAELERRAGESVDELRIRAMRDVVPNLPLDALRDANGKAVGYFCYSGM